MTNESHLAVPQGEETLGNMIMREQSLEALQRPCVNIITFGIDAGAGLIIAISAIFGLESFLGI